MRKIELINRLMYIDDKLSAHARKIENMEHRVKQLECSHENILYKENHAYGFFGGFTRHRYCKLCADCQKVLKGFENESAYLKDQADYHKLKALQLKKKSETRGESHKPKKG